MSSKVAIYRENIEPILQEIGNHELQAKVIALLAYAEQLETASRVSSGPTPKAYPVILPSRSLDATVASYLKDLIVQLQAEQFTAAAHDDFHGVIDMIDQS